MQEPIGQRMARYRLRRRWPKLMIGALTHWDVKIAAGPARPHAFGREPSTSRATRLSDGVVVDLTCPPTRESAGLPAGTGSRVWVNPARKPADVEVPLPDGNVYRARAVMAVMLSATSTGNPERLIVQLPPMGLTAAWQLIAGYASEWGFPAQEADTWRAGAALRAPGGRDGNTGAETYSTHIFTAKDAGFVHLEFQVSHHVRDGEFVIAALFSWKGASPGSESPRGLS